MCVLIYESVNHESGLSLAQIWLCKTDGRLLSEDQKWFKIVLSAINNVKCVYKWHTGHVREFGPIASTQIACSCISAITASVQHSTCLLRLRSPLHISASLPSSDSSTGKMSDSDWSLHIPAGADVCYSPHSGNQASGLQLRALPVGLPSLDLMFDTTAIYSCHWSTKLKSKGWEVIHGDYRGPNICHHKIGLMVTENFTVAKVLRREYFLKPLLTWVITQNVDISVTTQTSAWLTALKPSIKA